MRHNELDGWVDRFSSHCCYALSRWRLVVFVQYLPCRWIFWI
jgi:hypothetical protein